MTDDDSSDSDEQDRQLHLVERYERVVESQLSALTNVDTNAWRAARLIGILLGILLTGLSIVAQGDTEVTFSLPALLFFTVGIMSLLLSLLFATVSILNVEVGYGPGTDITDGLTNGEISSEGYPAVVSKSLANSIKKNKTVLSSKADKLRYTYNFLIVGLVSFSTAGSFLIISPSTGGVIAVIVCSIAAMISVSHYIINKKYESENNRDDEDDEKKDNSTQ